MPPDSELLASRVGFWHFVLKRSSIPKTASGLATLWEGYSEQPRELIGSQGIDLSRLGLEPFAQDGSLYLWQYHGDTVGMVIGSPWEGQGISLFAVGVGDDSISGCWHQLGPDSVRVRGVFRLDQLEGPST